MLILGRSTGGPALSPVWLTKTAIIDEGFVILYSIEFSLSTLRRLEEFESISIKIKEVICKMQYK